MKNYHEFTVGKTEYKARLSAGACVALEKQYGTSPINMFAVSLAKEEMPSLGFMLDVLHGALQKYHNRISLEKVYDIYDDMIDEGMLITDLFNIIMKVMMASGYFKETQTSEEAQSEQSEQGK